MSVKSVRQLEVSQGATTLDKTTSAASTLQELIFTIPQSYRAQLGDYLTKKYRLAHKHANVQSTISQYERHQTDASFPPIIRNSLKDPKLQFAKEFLNSLDGSGSQDSFLSAIVQARKNVLDSAVKEKKKELACLSKLIKPDESVWKSSVLTVASKLALTYGGAVAGDQVTGLPAAGKAEHAAMLGACAVYTYRCLALARAAIDRTDLQKFSKLKLKEDTDVTMKDADNNQSVKDIVREEIASLRKELKNQNGTSNPAAKRKGPLLTSSSCQVKKVRRSGGKEPQGSSEDQRQEQQEASRKEVSVDAFLEECSRNFRPWLGDTFPNVYLELSDECRSKLAVAFLRTWEVDSIRTARPGVFKQDGVSLPEDVEYSLSVNHKFILHSRPKDHDVSNARERFTRTVRVRWHFRHQRQNETEYIPKFHVPNPFWEPPKASPAIELGIDCAMEEIDSQVGRALSGVALDAPRHRNMNWNRVQQFLSDNGLIVKLTDKNLGLAVFHKEWYIHECMKMLGDVATYRMANSLDVQQLRQEMLDQMRKWHLPKNMERFLREKTMTTVPQFHCIPKVHKTPWALRPIVPSHSWVTSRLSEIVDHLCRPILSNLPWVVNSTKEVINHIDKIRLGSKDVWICTGDVVSFYTNIDSQHCARLVAGAFERYCKGSKINGRNMTHMIQFVMDNNYFQFQDQIWKQLNGLAMGTSCAPVLANIYAGFFERQDRLISQPGVLSYLRYIDDILLIFEGTEKELTAFLSKVKLGSLTVNWSYSRTKKEFLDIEIMKLPSPLGPYLATKLFRKELNKHLYIPWSSAHPLHVKKAFVKAELIRFAIVSSEVGYFAESRRQFYGNLRRRGYPPETLENWFLQVSFEKRAVYLDLAKPEEDIAPLMLSGQYNPVWEYINVEEISRAMRRGFSLEKELPDSLKQPLIRSLRRSTNLSDLLSMWNKTILQTDGQSQEKPTTMGGSVVLLGGMPGARR